MGGEGSGLIPGSGTSPGGGNGNPFQYSCRKNPRDGGAWRAIRVARESDTTERLNTQRQREGRF